MKQSLKETRSYAPSFNLRRANQRRANLRRASGDSYIFIFVFKDLTGMSPKSPYEEPRHPELSLDTVSNTIDKTVNYVIEFLVKQVRLLLQCPHN